MTSERGVLSDLRWPLLGLVGLFTFSTIGYVILGFGILESFHQTVLVLTTVGFQTEGALSTAGKVLTASVALLGVALFLISLAMFTSAVVEGRVGLVSRRRRMQRRIDDLRKHFIVCAYGRVGRAAARELESDGVPFVVVDKLDELEERMRSDGVLYVVGDPTSDTVLRSVGIDSARGLLSAVDSDADNVYIVLTARALNPDLFIVARASESAAAERLYRAGADRVISPYVSSGRHMAHLAVHPRVVDYLEILAQGEDKLRVEEVRVDEGSHLVGRTVGDVGGNATPLAVRRQGGEIVTHLDGNEELRAGDLLVLLGRPGELRRAEDR